jgi:hypothetical protein
VRHLPFEIFWDQEMMMLGICQTQPAVTSVHFAATFHMSSPQPRFRLVTSLLSSVAEGNFC